MLRLLIFLMCRLPRKQEEECLTWLADGKIWNRFLRVGARILWASSVPGQTKFTLLSSFTCVSTDNLLSNWGSMVFHMVPHKVLIYDQIRSKSILCLLNWENLDTWKVRWLKQLTTIVDLYFGKSLLSYQKSV